MRRRWILVALVVMLPFQSCWAAASHFCQHEEDRVTQHFGHHYHQHEAGASDGGQQGSAHGDCGYCYVDLAGVPIELPAAAAAVANFLAYRSVLDTFASVLADEPERPNWRHLA
jgi:hypothetical protein